MGIEVKQLTINSTLQREEDEVKSSDETEQKENKKDENCSDEACFDADSVKADILAECKRMIRRAVEEQRSR